jgi:hypothetical protein
LLAELEKREVLPRANQMDIDSDELLNPKPEQKIVAMDVSDEEIFKSVHEPTGRGNDGNQRGDHRNSKPLRCSSSTTCPAMVCSRIQ